MQLVHLDDVTPELLAGSHVVVLGGAVDVAAAARATAQRASGAVLLVATEDGQHDLATALEASLLPRSRVVAVEPGDAATAVAALLYGRDTALTGWAFCRGELGIEGRVAQVPLTLGAGGLRGIGRAAA